MEEGNLDDEVDLFYDDDEVDYKIIVMAMAMVTVMVMVMAVAMVMVFLRWLQPTHSHHLRTRWNPYELSIFVKLSRLEKQCFERKKAIQLWKSW